MDTPKLEPFSGARELRDAHDALMARVEQALAAAGGALADEAAVLRAMEAALRSFVERAVATGARVEAPDERSGCQALVDYWSTKLWAQGGKRTLPRLDAFDDSLNPDLPDSLCPFIGAQPYSAGGLFEGRRGETDAIVALVEKWPLVVVTGPPGSGKTSLVLAGALPRLRAQQAADGRPRWRVLAPVRMGPTLPADLAQAAAAAAGADAAALERAMSADAADTAALARALGDAAALPAVITVDQADGLLGAASQPALQAVVDALAQAAAAGHRVLLVPGEAFVERLLALPALAAWQGTDEQGEPRCGRLHVLPMSPAKLREAIVLPCEAVGLHLHADVVDDLVNRLAGQRAALQLLQHAMQLLWRHRRRNRVAWDDYLPLRDALDAEKWRVEAGIQRAAAERERAAAEASEVLARHEQRLFRRTRLAAAALAIVAAGLSGWAVKLGQENRELAQGNEELAKRNEGLEQELALALSFTKENGPLVELGRDYRAAMEKGQVLVDADVLRRAQAQAAGTAGAPAASAPAAAAPAPVPAPGLATLPPPAVPLEAARAVPKLAADTPPAPGAAVPQLASAPPAVAARMGEPAWRQAMETLSADDRKRRAQRLAFSVDQKRPATRVEELRRLHPLSWSWAVSRADDLKLRSPLALAMLYDTAIAHGPLQASTMKAFAAPSGGSLEDERRLVESILARRHALAATAFSQDDEPRRVAVLRALIDQDDWALEAYRDWGR